MGYNFHALERDQVFLLPPSMTDWLDESHLSWFLLDAVEHMDLKGFYQHYRNDGCGNTAYDPRMMVALLIYAYCHGLCSSRKIEKACQSDIGYRVISANQFPDHSTVARFRKKHADSLKDIFKEVLLLCAEAGLGKLGTVSLDGTKMKANASMQANRTEKYLDKEISIMLEEAERIDNQEDKVHGKTERGDELPTDLQKRKKRQEVLKAAKAKLDMKKVIDENEQLSKKENSAKRKAESDKPMRGRKPKKAKDDKKPEKKVNLTDLDSGLMKTKNGFIQGYNAQAVVSEDQIILVSEIVDQCNDQGLLPAMIKQTLMNVEDAGFTGKITNFAADAGYCNEADLSNDPQEEVDLYVATQKSWKLRKKLKESPPPRGRIPSNYSATERMTRKLLTKAGHAIYKLRGQTVEPVFGQIKSAIGIDKFSCRGAQLCEGEWALICACHNMMKLFRNKTASMG